MVFNIKVLKMKETRSVNSTIRIKPSVQDILKNSEYSYSDAVELFAYTIANQRQSKKLQLKIGLSEYRKMENELAYKRIELETLADELGVNIDDDSLFMEEIHNSVQTILDKYMHDKDKGDKLARNINEYVVMNATYIERHAERCNLTVEDLQQRVVTAYNKLGVQATFDSY